MDHGLEYLGPVGELEGFFLFGIPPDVDISDHMFFEEELREEGAKEEEEEGEGKRMAPARRSLKRLQEENRVEWTQLQVPLRRFKRYVPYDSEEEELQKEQGQERSNKKDDREEPRFRRPFQGDEADYQGKEGFFLDDNQERRSLSSNFPDFTDPLIRLQWHLVCSFFFFLFSFILHLLLTFIFFSFLFSFLLLLFVLLNFFSFAIFQVRPFCRK